MKNVFDFRDNVIKQYAEFSRSFTTISAPDIKATVDAEYNEGRYWPDPLIQINPNYQKDETVESLCSKGILNSECSNIFRANKKGTLDSGIPMTLYKHQRQAITFAQSNESYVVTTGTGSGVYLSLFLLLIKYLRTDRHKQKDELLQ